MGSHTNLLNWGPFEGAISILSRTLKEWLFLPSFSAIIYEKKVALPSGEGKADSLTKCSIQKTSSPFEGAGERNSGVTSFEKEVQILEIFTVL